MQSSSGSQKKIRNFNQVSSTIYLSNSKSPVSPSKKHFFSKEIHGNNVLELSPGM